MKKTVGIIVGAIFVFAIAYASFAAGDKAEMAKPSNNSPTEVTKTPAPTEKMQKLWEPNDQEMKELTPEEKQEQLKEFEEQEKQRLKKMTPEQQEQLKDWEHQEKPPK